MKNNRTTIKTGLIIYAVVCSGCFIMQLYLGSQANVWADSPHELTLMQMLLYEIFISNWVPLVSSLPVLCIHGVYLYSNISGKNKISDKKRFVINSVKAFVIYLGVLFVTDLILGQHENTILVNAFNTNQFFKMPFTYTLTKAIYILWPVWSLFIWVFIMKALIINSQNSERKQM